MNDSQLSAKWLEARGNAKKGWGKLINDEETQTRGRIDILTAKVKSGFSWAKEAVLHQVNEYLAITDEKKTPDTTEVK